MITGSKDKPTEQPHDADYEAIRSLLMPYGVELPPDKGVDQTIEALRRHVPVKPAAVPPAKRRWGDLMRRAGADIVMFSRLYWLGCLILFGAGLWFTLNAAQSSHTAVILLAPLPFMIGLLEVFKGREQGVLEIELACKISVQEIMLSRLLFILLHSLVWNTCLSGLLYLIWDDFSFWSLTWSWFTPFIIVASISLWIAMRIRGTSAIMVLTAVWMALGMIVLTNSNVMPYLMGINIGITVIINAGALLLLIREGMHLVRRHSFIVEGSLNYGAND